MKKGKRLFALMLALAMMVTILPQNVYASAAGEAVSETSAETVDMPLLTYVVVNEPEVSADGVQQILIGIGDEATVLDAATLTVYNETTGGSYTYDAVNEDALDGGAVLFEIGYDSCPSGAYLLSSLSYTYRGASTTLSFADIGIEARYGVETTVETEPDAVVYDEEEDAEDEVDLDVYSMDEDGCLEESDELTTVDSLEEALSVADNEDASAESDVKGAVLGASNVVVVLDPGHDDTHAGARANNLEEEDLTLKIAQYCKAELEQYAGVTVYMTRTSGACPNGGGANASCLAWRVNYAASVGAQYYVSIHLNSSSSSSPSGAEVYYPNGNYNATVSTQGSELAQDILDQLTALGLKDRTIKINNSSDYTYPDGSTADAYAVIRQSKLNGIAGIIIEHAFLTNASDVANFLSSDTGLQKLGVADATGIANYLGLSKGTNTSTSTSTSTSTTTSAGVTVYKGVDYSAVYDYSYYINKYSDLKAAFGNDPEGALKHFVTFGMSEKRQAKATFDVISYCNKYSDLRAAFGTDWVAYYKHYIKYGKNENRTATGCTEMEDYLTTYNGVDYSAVYDYNYYLDKYSDLKKAFEGDEKAALKHFVTYGMSEKRQAKATFDVTSYCNQYPDLRTAFGTDWVAYYKHYIKYGKNENRTATGCTEMKDYLTTYNGVDYSAVYDYNYYLDKYSDLKKAFEGDEKAALKHFVTFGMSEKRQAKATFNVTSYYNTYSDLQEAFGKNWKEYYLHYIKYGQKEGREATGAESSSGVAGVSSLQSYATVYNGVDYSAVYDYNYYLEQNSDLKAAFSGNNKAALEHFVNFGMSEGRQAKSSFDVRSYYKQYADLRAAFGTDWKAYYLHYINCGKAEGRAATGCTTLQGYVTTYNGVDYSAVYDYNYYLDKYSDLKAAFSGNDLAALEHFVNFGMSERRQAKASFDVRSYYNQYSDLRAAFGNNYKSYYLHYINCGKNEGRKTTGCTTLQGYVTVYNGVDYSAVYDYNYYLNAYADLKAAFSGNDVGALEHFVTFGMSEKRQAKSTFDVTSYYNQYPDLRDAFGNNWKSYYLHYITCGKNEGRSGTDCSQLVGKVKIMSGNTVSVAQLVAFFQNTIGESAFNSSLYGMSLTDFCQLYYDECAAEGVDVAVAFSQCMLETGKLQYGGQVQASQLNFAGIKNSDGSAFQTFSSVQEGIRAHVQHLKAYASTDALNNPCVDPRFSLVKRGSAPYVENLSAWAGGESSYPEKIIAYMKQL